ncbi:MAG: ABC transporter permease [Thermoflexales bacterium]|nr:ABC transporter permease [Thermoflexales bacterium]
MKQLLAVFVNTFKVEFSNRGAWISFVVLPLILTVVIGFATSGFGGDQRVTLGWVDRAGGAQAATLKQILDQSTLVRLRSLEEGEALQAIVDNKLYGAIIVPEGFSGELLKGRNAELTLHLPAADNLSMSVQQEIQSAVAQVSRTLLAAQISLDQSEQRRPFADAAERERYFAEGVALAEQLVTEAPLVVRVTQSAQSEAVEVPLAFTQSSPGQVVTWMLATLLAGAALLVNERASGTLRRLLTMPAPKWTILGGRLLGRFAMGAAQMVLMVAFGQWALGVQWGSSPAALAMVGASFGLAATALGLLIATSVRTEKQADTVVSLGTFLLAPLGGAWVPMEITPRAFQTAAQVFPTTWAMRGFIDVLVRGQGVAGVLPECGVLLGFAAVFFGLGIWRFKYE